MKVLNIKGIKLNREQLKELAELLAVQETTDKEKAGSQIELLTDKATYNYTVDKDYNIILKNVK